MKTSKLHTLPVALCTCAALTSGISTSSHADGLVDAIKNGKTQLNLRLRYEDVDQDVAAGADKTADALTLKTRLTLTSADYKGFSAQIEFDDVTELGSVDYNTSPADQSFNNSAIIADPEGTEVNQAWLAYNTGKTTFKYGRQRILLDNQRFVGGVGFRQNEQTYDGFSIRNKSFDKTEIFFAHITRVNRIFGESSPLGDHDNATNLFNLRFDDIAGGKLSLYHYDIDNEKVAIMSSKTTGLRYAGKLEGFSYALEFARQSDAHDNSRDYDANYTLLEGAYKLGSVTVKLGHEIMGGDGDGGYFITPLATLHKFQGWSDKFLNKGVGNIAGGLTDTYVSLATKLAGTKLVLVYHDIGADEENIAGTDSYGSELGLVVARKVGAVNLSAKFARFSEDQSSNAATSVSDTNKVWLTASIKI